jgi:hypothetical protein
MPAISASQAFNSVSGLNRRKKAEVPEILLKERDARPKVYIWNVYPVEWRRQISPHGMFVIPACSDNGSANHADWATVSKPLIVESIVFEFYDKGEGELALNYWDGRDVAKDITGESEGVPENDLRNWGVFISAGDKPTATELTEAKKRLTATMQKFLQQGDILFNGTQTERNQLSSIHRKAASYLGQYRQWDVTPVQMTDCRFCFAKVNPAAAKCNSCGSILDRQKWESGQEGYVPPAESPTEKPASKARS